MRNPSSLGTIPSEDLVNIKAKIDPYRSRRLKIFEGIRLLLGQVKKRNGYTQTVQEASFDVNAWRDSLEGDTPKIYVVDDGTPVIERKAGRQREYVQKVNLFGVTKGLTFKTFEEHIADIEEMIENYGHICGVANRSEVANVITDNQLFSEKEDTRLYEMTVEVFFIRCHGDPR